MLTLSKKISLSLITALLLAGGLTNNPAAAETGQIFMGSVAMDTPVDMIKRFTLLTNYLSAETGLAVSFRASPNMDAAIGDLGSNRIQIAYLSPVAYIRSRKKFGIRPLVEAQTLGESTFKLVVVVAQDSPLKTMHDLKGKTFAFGDEKAILQRAVVNSGGIKLEDLGHYAYLNHYDNIAKAVLNKDFDAGVVKESIFVEYRNRGLRVIHSSPPLPPYLFAVSNKMPPATAKKLRDALVALKADSVEHNAILKELDKGYDGFTDAHDRDYDVVRKLIAPLE
jgi:phosphonate transport system substrate-binding protein